MGRRRSRLLSRQTRTSLAIVGLLPIALIAVADVDTDRPTLPPRAGLARATPPTNGPRTAAVSAASRDRSPPPAPAHLAVTELTETALDVTWVEGEPSAGVAGASVLRYELIRDGAALAVVEGGTRFTDTELRAGTVHCYRVVAVGAEGHRSAPSPEACGAARDVLPPTVPGRVTAVVENPSSVALSWPPSEDDSGRVWYEVYDGDAHLVTLRATSWTHTGAAAQEHRYSVCAMDDAGNRSVAAEFTRVSLGDVEPPTAPRGLTLTAVSPTQIELTWTPSSDNIGVAHYEVLTGGEPFLRSDGTTALASPLTEWEEHCLSIRAVDGAGNRSEPSTVVCSRTMDRAFWKARNEAGARESRRRM